MEQVELKLAWANYKATLFACKHWHYSKSVPSGKIVKIGVWEDGVFKGVVLFSHGANFNIGSPYNLKQRNVCELTRIALTDHKTPVTRIVSIAIKMLKKLCPEVKLIVSYADLDQGHEGKIYKAGNWIYEGLMKKGERSGFLFKGKKTHPKSIHGMYGTGTQSIKFLQTIDKNVKELISKGKHKFLYVLDESIRDDILKIVSKA